MNYKILEQDTFNVIGVSQRISFSEGTAMFTEFWNRVRKGEIYQKMEAVSNHKIPGMLAMMSDYNEDHTEMTIMLGFTTDEESSLEELEVYSFPKATWLVAEVVGRPSKVMSKAWDQLTLDIIPSTPYEEADLPQFEAYIADSFTNVDSVNEIWIPLIH